MELGIKGKWALITGGTQGIGLAIAEELAAEGVNLLLASRSKKNIDAATDRVKKKFPGVSVLGVEVDLLDAGKLEKAIGKIAQEHSIDILVNNVGGPAAGLALSISLEDWDKGYQSLIRSALMMTKAFTPGMKAKKWGRVLTVTSTSAREIIPRLPVSSTFRSGLSALTKILAKEVGREGILINNLLPGPTDTGRLEELKVKDPAFFKAMETETAVGRVAAPAEIAKVAAFLVSNANTYLTGTDILADGGFTKAI